MSDKKTPETPQPAIEYSRVDDFVSAYANNVFFESSLWDLKLIFGQNDQHVSSNAVVQHTSITLPWPQVKLMMYLMGNNLLAHEIQNGRVHLAPNLITPLPDAPEPELLARIPKLLEIHAAFKAKYEAFLIENPEAAPPTVDSAKRK
jgi:hypothetical protein